MDFDDDGTKIDTNIIAKEHPDLSILNIPKIAIYVAIIAIPAHS